MKSVIVLLCVLCLVLAYGAAFGESPTAAALSAINAQLSDIKDALSNIPPAWSKTLQCDTTACPRFELVMGGAAVLDHETGLVWEQSPDTNSFDWVAAQVHCISAVNTGGRFGWKLPTIQELANLIDRTGWYPDFPGPTLPAGHPFSNVGHVYWSATAVSTNTVGAWYVDLQDGGVNSLFKSETFRAWCVRGGQGIDLQP